MVCRLVGIADGMFSVMGRATRPGMMVTTTVSGSAEFAVGVGLACILHARWLSRLQIAVRPREHRTPKAGKDDDNAIDHAHLRLRSDHRGHESRLTD